MENTKQEEQKKQTPDDFQIRSKEFDKKVGTLAGEYQVKLGVNILPDNWFTKIFKRLVKVKYVIIIVDQISPPK